MKCDLHRHLGGSIRPNTIYDILRREKRGTYFSVAEVAKDMIDSPNDKRDFAHFLDKFSILETVVWDDWAIKHMITQVSWDIASEGLDYVEIKLTLDKYLRSPNWTPATVVRFIYDTFMEQAAKWGFVPALVLALRYDTDREQQLKIAKAIADPLLADRVVGLDLVGDERMFDADFYKPIFDEWRQAGKGLEAHVGETQNAENVRMAIEKLGVKRIAHGIKAADSPDILAMAKERGICFDIALTSNIDTGAVKDLATHPVRKMLDQGCAITIGTDDPVTLSTTLDQEYEKLRHYLELTEDQLMDIMHNSFKYAFVDLNTLDSANNP